MRGVPSVSYIGLCPALLCWLLLLRHHFARDFARFGFGDGALRCVHFGGHSDARPVRLEEQRLELLPDLLVVPGLAASVAVTATAATAATTATTATRLYRITRFAPACIAQR